MNETTTLAIFSFASLGLGGGLVWAANHRPSRAETLERCGGALLATGLALLGAALHRSVGIG